MDSNVENVCKALKKREEKGMTTYGVSTDRTDLTTEEWLQHLQEELMDACVYIEKLKREFQFILSAYFCNVLLGFILLHYITFFEERLESVCFVIIYEKFNYSTLKKVFALL